MQSNSSWYFFSVVRITFPALSYTRTNCCSFTMNCLAYSTNYSSLSWKLLRSSSTWHSVLAVKARSASRDWFSMYYLAAISSFPVLRLDLIWSGLNAQLSWVAKFSMKLYWLDSSRVM